MNFQLAIAPARDHALIVLDVERYGESWRVRRLEQEGRELHYVAENGRVPIGVAGSINVSNRKVVQPDNGLAAVAPRV